MRNIKTLSRTLQQPPGGDIAAASRAAFFDFARMLPGRASSRHTQRAYFRWVDDYLVRVAGIKPTSGEARHARMAALPVALLQASLSAAQMRAWLGMLVNSGQGKQALQQARAAIITLAGLLAETGWLDEGIEARMARVRIPKAEEGQRPGRWLSTDEVNLLMASARRIATSENQLRRNQALTLMLCTMALRREEASAMRWGDLSIQNNRVVLRVHGKSRKTAIIDVPRVALAAIDGWRRMIVKSEQPPTPDTPLLRRLWKGGAISTQPLGTEGIWLIIADAAADAGIGHVAPHDLRRSVAGALEGSGVPIETISRLLRHSNIAMTERYLSRLPKANPGAVLMSDLLGLSDEPLDLSF